MSEPDEVVDDDVIDLEGAHIVPPPPSTGRGTPDLPSWDVLPPELEVRPG